MKHSARVAKTATEVMQAIDSMPKERGTDFYAGRSVASAVNRTYTRVDGNGFQVSRTAGMGSPVVASGKVADDEQGGAVVYLSTTFGLVPLGTWLIAGFVILAVALYFANAGNYYLAAGFVAWSWLAFGWFVAKFWEARYLRSELSKYLGGVEWVPQKTD